ncbi:MAG: hypothetical protein ABR591_15640, partial [Candidatus Velthaea sp.]
RQHDEHRRCAGQRGERRRTERSDDNGVDDAEQLVTRNRRRIRNGQSRERRAGAPVIDDQNGKSNVADFTSA